jgi:hypothetical protein
VQYRILLVSSVFGRTYFMNWKIWGISYE